MRFKNYIKMKLNEWCYRPWFCTCKAILDRWQHGLMRCIVKNYIKIGMKWTVLGSTVLLVDGQVTYFPELIFQLDSGSPNTGSRNTNDLIYLSHECQVSRNSLRVSCDNLLSPSSTWYSSGTAQIQLHICGDCMSPFGKNCC